MKKNQTRKTVFTLLRFSGLSVLTAIGLIVAGCKTNPHQSSPPPTQGQPIVPYVAPTPAAPAPSANTAPASGAIRIKAGVTTPLTDSDGIVWQPDQGFADGDTIARPDVTIENTKNQALYQSEHYGMTSFTWPVPNGKYIVKLHFAETYEGITGPGQRVFSVNVQGHEIKDLDIWAKTGGAMRPWIETVPIEVTDGKVHITFTPNVENPQINALEIIPEA